MYELVFAALVAAHLFWLIVRFCRNSRVAHWGVLATAWFVITMECLLALAWDWPVASQTALLLGLLPPVIILAWITLRKLLRPQERE